MTFSWVRQVVMSGAEWCQAPLWIRCGGRANPHDWDLATFIDGRIEGRRKDQIDDFVGQLLAEHVDS